MTDQSDHECSGFINGAGLNRGPIFESNALTANDSDNESLQGLIAAANAALLPAGRLPSEKNPDGRILSDVLSTTRAGFGNSKPVNGSKLTSRDVAPLNPADDSLRAYFSALGNYQSPGVDEENEFLQNLAGTEQKLLSVLAQFPGTSHWLLNPDRRWSRSTQTEADSSNSNDHPQRSEDPLLKLGERRTIGVDSSPDSDLKAFAAASVAPDKQVVQIDWQMAVLSKLHGDLIASSVRYGADHPICGERRRILACEFRKLQLPPGCVPRLVDRLLTLARELGEVESQFEQPVPGHNCPAEFEKQYGIGFSDFDRIVNQSLLLYQQWQQQRNALVERHLGFVVYLAKKYSTNDIDFLDLIQEGNIGLIKAVEHFDYRLGFKFSTYASYWIRLEISRFVARNGQLLRLPYRLNRLLGTINRNAELFRQSNGHDPSESELARNSGISVSRLRTALRFSQAVSSLDRPFEDNEDLDLFSLVEQQVFPQPEDAVYNQRLKEFIESAMIKLNRQETFIVRQRFGIGTYQECTLQEVGDVLGLTRERVRQIEARALQKLRRRLTSASYGVMG